MYPVILLNYEMNKSEECSKLHIYMHSNDFFLPGLQYQNENVCNSL